MKRIQFWASSSRHQRMNIWIIVCVCKRFGQSFCYLFQFLWNGKKKERNKTKLRWDEKRNKKLNKINFHIISTIIMLFITFVYSKMMIHLKCHVYSFNRLTLTALNAQSYLSGGIQNWYVPSVFRWTKTKIFSIII